MKTTITNILAEEKKFTDLVGELGLDKLTQD